MPFIAGVVLAFFVAVTARLAALDRDSAFYPTILIVIASYYALFAVMGGSISVLLIEVFVIAAFFVAAIVGFKRSLWLVIGGLAGHGVFDFFHGSLVANPGVPDWWPPFCLAFDVTLAVCVAWMLHTRKRALFASRGDARLPLPSQREHRVR